MKFLRYRKPKVFVVGSNKTGTTSLGAALKELGFRLGNQRDAELLIDDWAHRDFTRIIKHCRSADAFQDIPFSLDYTFQAVDAAFPGSKFILSVRDSPDQWYQSLVRFHAKRRGLNRPPTPDELKQDPYVKLGYQWHASKLIYGIDENSVWNEEMYKKCYLRHLESVQEYFKFRPSELLTINVSDVDAMPKMCKFLGVSASSRSMPHLNRSN